MMLSRRSLRVAGSMSGMAAAVLAACSEPVASGRTDPPSGIDSTRAPAVPAKLDSLPRALTTAERSAVTAGGDFTFALFREVNRRKPGTNVFVSPLSAAVALAMTAQGAAGETDVAMRRTLGFADQPLATMGEGYRGLMTVLLGLDSSVTLRTANAIWYRRGLAVQPSFVDATQRLFGAQVTAADFANVTGTVSTINGWAKAQTNGKIEKVIETVTPDQVMFLLNALYFKGAWRDRFDPARTSPATFTSANGQAKSVEMMHRTGAIHWAAGDGFEAVDLPYGNGAFSLTVLLPNAARTADALASSLDVATWTQLAARLGTAQIELAMPKFTFSYEDEWKDVLTTLGMGVAFSDVANFSAMVQGGGVKIDFVKQNSYVDVNEQGTEAAAVTSIGIGVTSAPVTRPFHVDRPFVFVIHEKFSGAVLFVGKVDAP